MRLPFLSTIAVLLLAVSMPAMAQANDPSATGAMRVLFVGNSLTYANNLPRLLRAVAASQAGGTLLDTATYVIPGADLDALWDDGHAASALREGDWDVVVLQERGGQACSIHDSRDPDCRRSIAAHRKFAELAQDRGARVLLLMTWPPVRRGNDLGNARELGKRKQRLHELYDEIAGRLGRDDARVEVVPAAAALYDFAAGRTSADVLADGVHPTFEASLVMAAQLYAAISGHPPLAADLMIDFPLLPANALIHPDTPMETQAQIAGDGHRYLVKAGLVAPYYAIAAGN